MNTNTKPTEPNCADATALREALAFYYRDDQQSVEMGLLESVFLRPAAKALGHKDTDCHPITTPLADYRATVRDALLGLRAEMENCNEHSAGEMLDATLAALGLRAAEGGGVR